MPGDSAEWSDNSKQDSKDQPSWGRSQLETVKKRPLQGQGQEGVSQRGAGVRKAVGSLFAGHLLGNLAEGEALDHSVHEVSISVSLCLSLSPSLSLSLSLSFSPSLFSSVPPFLL